MSPTERSLAHLRKQGMRVQVVERWIPQARRRVDLFGFIDIVALDGLIGVLGIQTTTTGNMPHRMEKLRTEANVAMRDWLRGGNRLVIHGWAKRGARGKAKRWTLTERVIVLDDLRLPA